MSQVNTSQIEINLKAGKLTAIKKGPKMDLTGQRFGKLTVLSEAPIHITAKGSRCRRWVCKCDCGRTKIIEQNSLRRGATKSCGCALPPHRDLTGQVFGMLTVLEEAEPVYSASGRKNYTWLCQCSCGRKKIIPTRNLTEGHAKSCGCLNKFDLTGRTYGRLTIIKEVEPLVYSSGVRRRRWYCQCSCGRNITVLQSDLEHGKKSCGCGWLLNLTGQTYGSLSVLHEAKPRILSGRKRRYWVCKCNNCGKTVTVMQDILRTGRKNSCGDPGCLAASAASSATSTTSATSASSTSSNTTAASSATTAPSTTSATTASFVRVDPKKHS